MWEFLFGSYLTLLLTFILVTITLCPFIIEKWRRSQSLRTIPGPPAVPLLGNVFQIGFADIEKMFELLAKEYPRLYGSLYKVYVGPEPIIVATRASTLEPILSSSKLIDKSWDYVTSHEWLGLGLLNSTGEKWHSRRKLLTPAFHFQVLEDFQGVFHQEAQVFMEQLEKAVAENPDDVDIFPYITRYTLDVICETAMGHHVGVQEQKTDGKDAEYVKAVCEIAEILAVVTMKPWLRNNYLLALFPEGRIYRRCIKVLHAFTRGIISEKKREFAARQSEESIENSTKKKSRQALLDLLLTASGNGANLTDEDIREEVDTFMFEGHDTTAAGIGWCLYLLGRHPEIQDRVYEEIQNIWADETQPISIENLSRLKYLECCIKEAQRMYPSVPTIARELSEDVVLDNHLVPKGTTVFLSIYATHHDPEVFPDPEEYQPERFLPENARKRNPYAFVPFSAGQRNCIGQKFALMELKTIIATVLRRYRIMSLHAPEDMHPHSELVLRPSRGIHVKLVLR